MMNPGGTAGERYRIPSGSTVARKSTLPALSGSMEGLEDALKKKTPHQRTRRRRAGTAPAKRRASRFGRPVVSDTSLNFIPETPPPNLDISSSPPHSPCRTLAAGTSYLPTSLQDSESFYSHFPPSSKVTSRKKSSKVYVDNDAIPDPATNNRPPLHRLTTKLGSFLDRRTTKKTPKRPSMEALDQLKRFSVVTVDALNIVDVPRWRDERSTARFFWNLITFLAAVIQLSVTPMLIAFSPDTWNTPMFWMTFCMDVVFGIDVVLHAAFFHSEVGGTEITYPDKIFAHWRKTWMVVDVIAIMSLPLSVAIMAGPSGFMRNPQFLLLPRVLRAPRFSTYFSQLNVYLNFHRVQVNAPVLRATKIILVMVLSCFYFGSAFYYIACPNGECSSDGDHWVSHDGALEGSEPSYFKRLRVVYIISQIIFTVGYGDVNPVSTEERIFMVIIMLIGQTIFAVLIANMTSYISNLDVTYTRFRQELDGVEEYMRSHGLPPSLRSRAREYFHLLYTRQAGRTEADIIAGLPLSLSDELHFPNVKLLSTVPFFELKYRSIAFVHGVANAMEPRVYCPQDVFVEKNQMLQEMFMIRSGKAVLTPSEVHDVSSLVSPSASSVGVKTTIKAPDTIMTTSRPAGSFLKIPTIPGLSSPSAGGRSKGKEELYAMQMMSKIQLHPGDHFGVPSLLFGKRHPNTITATSFTDVLVLTVPGLNRVFDRPAFASLRVALYAHAKRQPRMGPEDDGTQDQFAFFSPDLDDLLATYRSQVSSDLGIEAVKKEQHQLQERANKMRKGLKSNKKGAAKLYGVLQAEEGGSDSKHQNAWVFMAHSPMRVLWDCVLLGCCTWYGLALPFTVTQEAISKGEGQLEMHVATSPGFHAIGFFMDVLFLLDIVLNSYCFAFNNLSVIEDEGKAQQVTDPKEILAHYIKSGRRQFDAFSSLPVELVVLLLGGSQLDFHGARLFRLLKCARIVDVLRSIKGHVENAGMRVSIEQFTVVKWLFTVVLFTHWSSCCWSAIHDGSYGYLDSMYYSLTTMTTVGFGDISPQHTDDTFVAFMVIALGTTLFAGVIATVSTLVHSTELSSNNPEHQHSCLQHYMMDRDLPSGLVEATKAFFKHHSQTTVTMDDTEALRTRFPIALRRDALYFVRADLLRAALEVGDMIVPEEVVKYLVLHLREELYSPFDSLFDMKETVTTMYVIKSGSVEHVSSGEGRSHEPLGEYDTFGTFGLFELGDRSRTFGARCLTFSHLYLLGRVDFERIMASHTDLYVEMETFVADDFVQMGGSPLPNTAGSAAKAVRQQFSVLQAMNGAQRGVNHRPSLVALKTRRLHEVLKAKQKRWSVWLPSSAARRWWEVMSFFTVLYQAFLIPIQMAFLGRYKRPVVLEVLDYFSDVVFVLDILLRSLVFGYSDGHAHIVDRAEIFEHYRHSGWIVWLDVIASLPLELLVLAIPHANVIPTYQFRMLLRFPKLGRLVRTPTVETLSKHLGLSKNWLNVSKLMVTVVYCATTMGALFFTIATHVMPGRCTDGTEPTECVQRGGFSSTNWALERGVLDEDDIIHYWEGVSSLENTAPPVDKVVEQAVASLYWATALLTTVGYGDIVPHTDEEKLFSTVALVIGTLTYSFMISNLEEIVAQIDVTSTLFQKRVDEIKTYMKYRKLDMGLQARVEAYLNTSWLHNRGVDEAELLTYLCPSLRTKFLRHFTGDLLSSIPLFRSCESRFLDAVMEKLIPDAFLPGDTIYETDMCGSELYLLTQGSVQLSNDDDSIVYTSFTDGSVFGEGEFLLKCQRLSKATAKSYCRVFLLRHEDLWAVLSLDRKHFQLFEDGLDSVDSDLETIQHIKKMQLNLKGSKMAKMMMDDAPPPPSDNPYVVLPKSNLQRGWRLLQLLMIVYNTIMIPLRVAFFGREEDLTYTVVDLIPDLLAWVNVALSIRCFAVYHQAELVTNPAKFRRLYMRWGGDGPLDLFANMPLDAIAAISGVSNVRQLALLRLPRLLLLPRSPSLLDIISQVLDERMIRLKSGVWHALKMYLFILITCHSAGCLLWYIGDVEEGESWVMLAGLKEGGEDTGKLWDHYVVSVYWSVYTLTTVGFGDITIITVPEMLFSILVMLTGAVLCDAGVTAILTSLISGVDEKAGSSTRELESVKRYMRYIQMHPALQKRVQDYHVYFTNDLGGRLEGTVLSATSFHLKRDILAALVLPGLHEVDIFRDQTEGFLKSLVQHMTARIATPREYLMRLRQPCSDVFMLLRGQAEFLQADNGLGVDLFSGSVFGDFTLPTSDVQCHTFCELLVLSEADYMSCITYLGMELSGDFAYPQPAFLSHASHCRRLSQAREESLRKLTVNRDQEREARQSVKLEPISRGEEKAGRLGSGIITLVESADSLQVQTSPVAEHNHAGALWVRKATLQSDDSLRVQSSPAASDNKASAGIPQIRAGSDEHIPTLRMVEEDNDAASRGVSGSEKMIVPAVPDLTVETGVISVENNGGSVVALDSIEDEWKMMNRVTERRVDVEEDDMIVEEKAGRERQEREVMLRGDSVDSESTSVLEEAEALLLTQQAL